MLTTQIHELLHTNPWDNINTDIEEENTRYSMFRPLLAPYMA